MSPINLKTIKTKLNLLQRNIIYLEKYRLICFEKFQKDFTLQGAVLYYLIECIEIIIDIGNHILAEEYLVKAENYADVIIKLGVYKVIPKKFASDNIQMTRFRNRIVHVYEETDYQEVYKILQKSTKIFISFNKYFMKYLGLK